MLQISRNVRLCLQHLSHKLTLKSCIPRNLSLVTKTKSAVAEYLDSRGILRVSGEEASVFIQGLITNDMRHIEEGAPSMYTMFLNTKGRVMYDAIIYKSKEQNVFLIECDKSASPQLLKHLKMYRVRRKIDIKNIDDELKVWVIFDPQLADYNENEIDGNKPVNLSGVSDSTNTEIMTHLGNRNDLIVCRDPRLSVLGVRVLAPSGEDISLIDGKDDSSHQKYKSCYRAFRFKLGIGEGVNDLPPGNCFPLEANGDYLHGVSFHKGCYIGQELTARTHHTGVVRKRLMPLFFHSVSQTELEMNASIQPLSGSNKVSLGKLRGVEHNIGLALLRVTEALDVSKLKISDVTAETRKPSWWPQEAPKERVFAGKT
ncbi:putative transferase CAF17 homolog, mitochondrial [Periplaneta americana]|uniref:putative transferase CAF17 homolog, mitochondrial n=1 Tax=Periplaneta americana TaxID=6978 RepID=UPI0037E8FFBD